MEPKLFDPNQTLAQRREHWAASLDLFPKGVGSLVSDGAYCCLGVACALAGVDPKPNETDLYGHENDVAELIGVDRGSSVENLLMALNDTSGDWAPVQLAIRELAAHTVASEQYALAAMEAVA